MIAKILTQSKTFSAVNYNERKVEKNLGEFVVAYNFGYLDLLEKREKKDYLKYLEQWAEKNKNVKNKQFHVAISCRGKEYEKEKLIKIGKQWMKNMGYGDLPTMIYFHSDTRNNHIHIISTRIGADGKKVNNDNERWRAREAINKIMKVDFKQNVRDDFSNALSFSFLGIKQFEMIMKSKGYNTKIDGKNILIYKEGKEILNKEISLINWAEKRKEKRTKSPGDENKKRNRQIYSILRKYRKTTNLVDLQKLLKQQFGISLLFFQKKEHDKPYGYSIIDEKSKRVIKGSEIMKLKELLLEEPDRIKAIEGAMINLIERENNCINRISLDKELRRWGAVLRGRDVINKRTKEVLFELNDLIIDKLNYSFRFERAKKYNINNQQQIKVLSKFFNINSSDLELNMKLIDKGEKDYYIELLRASENDRDLLYSAGIFIVKDGKENYLIDKENEKIYSFDEIGYINEQGITFNSRENNESEEERMIEEILELLMGEDTIGYGGADNRLKKKKMKK